MPRRPPARYGYARAATHDAVLAQETALIEAGCETVWKDTATGKLAPRPGWKACRAGIGRGDTLAVTRLAVLAFSLRELLAEAGRLAERGITLQVLDQDVHPGTRPQRKAPAPGSRKPVRAATAAAGNASSPPTPKSRYATSWPRGRYPCRT